MTAIRYQHRPFTVDAIQLDRTEETAARIEALIGVDRFTPPDPAADAGDHGFAAGVLTDPHSVWREVYTGQWVIRREDGYVFVLTDDQFHDAYEAVPYTVDEAGVHVYNEE